jgi:ABC-type nitrate/sulfonate/bicarbonate transport system substrate-binding protein
VTLAQLTELKIPETTMPCFLFRLSLLWTALALLAIFPASGDAATAEKINASYGAISGLMAPIWVAKEARLFDKQGLDLNLVYIPGGPRSIMSLIGDSVQFVNHSVCRLWRPTSAARTPS